MMRSLFSGVAGLKTHQTKMDVIGNNIANVNTVAFKSSSITFNDLMSQTTQNASGANAQTGVGGTNARQIGLGVKSGAISMNIKGQGSAQSTGNPFDIMITGDNFFVVNNGLENFFTRDGSFYVDGVGNLAMASNGYNVMGWQVDPETMDIKKDTVSALRIMSAANLTYPPEATSAATVTGILDKADTDVTSDAGMVKNLNFYDSLGYQYTARLVFKNADEDGVYSVEVSKILDADGNTITDGAGNAIDFAGLFGDSSQVNRTKNITFNATGTYSWAADGKSITVPGTPTGGTISNLANLVSGTGLDLTQTVTYTPDGGTAEDMTGEAALALIAKGYGYEGDTKGFLNLVVTTENSTTTSQVTIEEMLAKQFGATNDQVLQTLKEVGEANLNADGTSATFVSDGSKFNGALLKFDPDTGNFNNINGGKAVTLKLTDIIANADTGASNFSDITIDFSGMTMFNNNGTSTVTAAYGDSNGLNTGRMLGEMIGVSIQKDGKIYASYDNGMTKLLGQIATANFANSSGLEKKGDNLYSSTMNSGQFDNIGVDITSTGGYMTTGVLEMSNVDLSSEFTEMITTQRGFQANSRIITVSDTLLEELTNLKR
ncbi:MAG: flagellar hook-basal body complex protein [Lachnospiraceae bacterium]|nr:flagellar hook-basal body complex protein [Lachnospiraceae bacterium]